MSLQLPRKRTLLAWHRWLGFVATLFLIILSITGLALNHTERLKLDQVILRNDFILKRYGMSGGSDLLSYRISETDSLSYLDGQFFFNQRPLVQGKQPIGIVLHGNFTLIVTEDALIYLTPDGDLIEKVETNQLPLSGNIQAIGYTDQKKSVVVTSEGNWTTDPDWLNFQNYQGSYSVDPLPPEANLTAEQVDGLLTAFQGEGISLYRVILDLHSGRLFGWGGRTVMDLTAVAILLLIASGLAGYFRVSRRKTTA